MPNRSQSTQPIRLLVACLGLCAFATLGGCQDGPMYALKVANPYFSMGEWKRDEKLGVTDHERRRTLTRLAETIDGLPADRQAFWAGHLDQMLQHDPSPEMRRLAISAAGRLQDPLAMPLIQRGLEDDSIKVRMEACRSLGRQRGDESARTLAKVAGTESNQDVRHAALTALSKHKSPLAIDSLKLALSDRDPATRDLAINSLRGVTDRDFGNDPKAWIAGLNKSPPSHTADAPETRIAERDLDRRR